MNCPGRSDDMSTSRCGLRLLNGNVANRPLVIRKPIGQQGDLVKGVGTLKHRTRIKMKSAPAPNVPAIHRGNGSIMRSENYHRPEGSVFEGRGSAQEAPREEAGEEEVAFK